MHVGELFIGKCQIPMLYSTQFGPFDFKGVGGNDMENILVRLVICVVCV